MKIKDSAAPLRTKENTPLLVAQETVERRDGDAFRQQAEQIRSAVGELLPGVEYSEGGDQFSLSFLTEVEPKRKKHAV